MKYKYNLPSQSATKMELIHWRFKEIGINLTDCANIVLSAQKAYNPELTLEDCKNAIQSVLKKREIQHALITAINLDVLCEQGKLIGPLQSIVWEDRGTFGVDEVLINSANLYGTIGITNSFELDKNKPGLIKEIDQLGKNSDYCCTFLDDMICVLCGSAMGQLAHKFDKSRNKSELNKEEKDTELISELFNKNINSLENKTLSLIEITDRIDDKIRKKLN